MSGENGSEVSETTSWNKEPHGKVDIPPSDQGTYKEPHALEAEDVNFSEYRTALEKILSSVVTSPLWDRFSGINSYSGETEGRRFTISAPHLRRGKSSFVGLVDISNPDGTVFSSVVKNDIALAEEYLQFVSQNPQALEFLPKYYGNVDDWIVTERLYGLELQEVEWKIQKEPEFLEKYTGAAADLMLKTAKAGLVLQDIAFIDAHNVIIDPETGKSQLIEVTNLTTYPHRNTNEIITNQLFREFQNGSHKIPGRLPTDIPFKIAQKIFQSIPPENLYIRREVFAPSNPKYRDNYETFQNWEFYHENGYFPVPPIALTDEEYELRLLDSENNQFFIPDFSSQYTEIISAECMRAIQDGDIKAFEEILERGKQTTFITDMSDPRSDPIVHH